MLSGATNVMRMQSRAARYSRIGALAAMLLFAATEVSAAPTSQVAPTVLGSTPSANASNVAVSQRLTIQFSKPMAAAKLNATTVTLIGPAGSAPIDVALDEQGTALSVAPSQELLPASAYTLFVKGATDASGHPLALTAIGFKTAALGGKSVSSTAAGSSTTAATSDSAGAGTATTPTVGPSAVTPGSAANDGESWTPGEQNYHGNWRSGGRPNAAQTLPNHPDVRRALHGDPALAKLTPADVANHKIPVFQKTSVGTTAIAGQVLLLNGLPLERASLSIGKRLVKTDSKGEFLLSEIPSGHQVLVIDGETASHGAQHYGRYEYGIDVTAGETNVLPFVIWMTKLDMQDAVQLAAPTTAPTVLTNPSIPGLELRIPAGSVIRDAKGKIVTEVSMTAVPVDQPPFPIPNFPVPVYFTVQPGGAHLEGIDAKSSKGAQLIYPNYTNSPPGTRFSFWDYDATGRGWFEYGQGTVTADAKQIMPDPGVVIFEFSGAMVSQPSNAPPAGPQPCTPKCADPVDVFTGLFTNEETDLVIPDVVPITISRSYRPADETSRGFGVGTNLSYDFFIVGTSHGTAYSGGTYTYQDLILPDGGHIHFARISPGSSYADAVYQNTSTPGRFYGAIIKWYTVSGGWILTLKDGSTYIFGDSDSSYSPRYAAVRQIIDRHGNSLALQRDGNSNLTQITSPNGRTVKLTYDTANRVTQVADDIGRTFGYSYDAAGRLAQVTDPAGNIEKYTYESVAVNPALSIGGVSATTNMLTVQDKRGLIKVTNVYDANGRVTKQTYADGRTYSFAYTLTPFTQTIDGTTTTITYDIVSQADATDERGTVTRYILNTKGYPTSIIKALGRPEQQTTTFTRDPNTNLVASVTDALGRTTAFQYDALGNVTQRTELSGTTNAVTTKFTYDPVFSQLTSITDPNGNALTMNYDAQGNLTQVTDALGHTGTTSYDSRGRVTSVQDALNQTTTFTYSGPDLGSVTDPLNRTTTMFTDSVGRVRSVTNTLGMQSVLTYDALNRLTAFTDPKGGVTQWTYDGNGNISTEVDQNKNSTSFTYDGRSRLSGGADALGHTLSVTSEPGGKVGQFVDRKGQVVGVTYDGLGRPTQIGYGATVANPTTYKSTIAISWDAGDRPTQFVDSASGTITRTYDGLDRLLSETTPLGAVSYTYDAGGRRTSMTVLGQPTVSYTWDAANRLTKFVQAAGTSNNNVAQSVSFSYDNASRRTQTVFGNGIIATYTYDSANQLTAITYKTSSGTLVGDLTYTYDAAGRRTATGGTLAQVQAGAIVGATQFNANNELSSWGGNALSYDANGNLLSDGTNTYTWDERNHLQSINGAVTASFQYDAVERRIGKTIGSVSTGYLYDGINVVQEKNGTGAGATVTANLLSGLSVDELYERLDSTGAYIILTDALGSAIVVTNGAQATVASYIYDSYGNTTQTGTNANSQQYTGRENDQTGLYYYRARYYNPKLGRFISEDPIGWASGQTNNYSYVGGSPLTHRDPTGLGGGPSGGQYLPQGTVPQRIPNLTNQQLYDALSNMNDNSHEGMSEKDQKQQVLQKTCDWAPAGCIPDVPPSPPQGNPQWCREVCPNKGTQCHPLPDGTAFSLGDGCYRVCTPGPFFGPH
jgi:RHS repeat-associated protein